jgi:DNA segregation ATPase FtsK/SpoIIIE, S-DNA-T family
MPSSTRAPWPVTAEPALALAPVQRSWPSSAIAVVAVTLVLAGGSHLLQRGPGPYAMAAAGLVVLAAVIAHGVRESRRQLALDMLVLAVHPLLGHRVPTRSSVSAARWTRGREPVPTRLRIFYAPGAPDTVDWVAKVAEVASRRLGASYSVDVFDQRRCRVQLRAAAPKDEAPVSATVARAERIVRAIFGEAAQVELDVVDGEVVAVRIRHNLGSKVARQHARSFIENSVGALLPGRWRATWELTEDRVRFEQRPTMPTHVPHVPDPITKDNLKRIKLAIDEYDDTICWNLAGSGPHLMVVGKTGTGKTVAINGVVMEAARRTWAVWICDPKRIEFMGLRDWPNVQIVATTVVDMIATIYSAHELMEQRYAAIENGADEGDFEPLVLVLDEFRNFHRQVASYYTDVKVRGMAAKAPVFDWVAAIAEKGRSAGIHLVLGTQRPDADFMTGSMRDNFDSRLALGRLSPQGAQMMWESPYLGVSVPRSIRGRGTGITDSERVTEAQVLWTPDPRRATRDNNSADLALLAALRPAASSHPRLEVELGPETDLEGHEFNEWQQLLECRLVPVGEAITRPLGAAAAALRQRAGRRALAAAPAPAVDRDVSADYDEAGPDLLEGYGPGVTTSASRLAVGDLVLVDEFVDLWAAVEAVDVDPTGEEYVCVSWRADDGEVGDLSLHEDDAVSVRRPLTEPDEEAA